EIMARGKSVDQIRAEVVSLIERFIPDPEVNIALMQINGNRIYVIGKVNRPGDFVPHGDIDIMQALSMAGGTTPFAELDEIKVLRRKHSGQIAISFHYGEVEEGRNLDQNILLRSGDVVVVP
ncbi:MAG: polysaccharide export protein, partial [Gammaproteobacteria bacterium]|nr:polysaccharide export protein [Gammaproteobacteria bacterium]